MDLASLESVSEAAARLLEQEGRIDLLVNNAGVAGHRDVTLDGFEIQLGVNDNGGYYQDEARAAEQPLALDSHLAEQLWDRGEDMVRRWL